ncbi:hypothetical protein CHS0354_023030 [Potamilus streckersoni]|uniref:Uncharacterized protein n=1 Tax=Potamilus streckersoni TaxID=2493646 RepID=A0AAE0RWT4_9BIVA|nr:hypothetical protein CHS0354_023030 [Potamilus streckersoni]
MMEEVPEPAEDNTEEVISPSPEEIVLSIEKNMSKDGKWQDVSKTSSAEKKKANVRARLFQQKKAKEIQLIERDIAPYFILEEPHYDGKKTPETVECQNTQENKTKTF